MPLDDLVKNAWAAYGRGDLDAARAFTLQARQIAPHDPQVDLLLQRLDTAGNGNEFGRGRIAIFFTLLEAVTAVILFQAVGVLRVGGMAAGMEFGGSITPALNIALGCGAAALVLPPLGWIVWRGMR